MFELFLVMIALTSPILIIIFVRNYFNYKSEVNQKILALQKDSAPLASPAQSQQMCRSCPRRSLLCTQHRACRGQMFHASSARAASLRSKLLAASSCVR